MSQTRIQIAKSRKIPNPHAYVKYLLEDYASWAYDEERAPAFKGCWRERVFNAQPDVPLDLEIGTGNGYFFAHHAHQHPERLFVGLEIKFKPLIQSIRRALNRQCQNARMVRYPGQLVDELFVPGELDDVYIHHPDPWERPRRYKHRLVQEDFLRRLYQLQKPGSKVEFKTDSRDYFLWAVEQIKKTDYTIERYTLDLHQSEWAAEQPILTSFERIFVQKQVPINYLWLRR